MLKGILFSLSASLLFGVMYYLSSLLRPLSGEGIFGFRMWVSLPFLVAAVFLFKQQSQFIDFLKQLKQKPKLIIVLIATTLIGGSQMWLFLWAPNNNAAIDVSIGYLLMPIVMAGLGRVWFKELISPLKFASIIFAFVGVMSSFVTAGSISWATWMVLTGFPIYFSLRKHFNISHISSFLCEIILLLPIATYFIWQTDMTFIESQNPNIYYFLTLLGIVSGIALISYIMASSLLPLNVMGLLSYMEPMMMLIVSFLIGEALSEDSYILMICLAISVALLMLDGIVAIKKQKKGKSTEC
ncbi:EamA family transporter [Pasteurellaceae bacterium 15-036681]|nr:EamA family transporter [Pasteurellaceae bacterium 15-036681]